MQTGVAFFKRKKKCFSPVRTYSTHTLHGTSKMLTFRTNKMMTHTHTLTQPHALSLPMVPLRENRVSVRKDHRVKVLIIWRRLSAATAPENEDAADLQHRGQLRVQTRATAGNTVKVTTGTPLTTSDSTRRTQSPSASPSAQPSAVSKRRQKTKTTKSFKR